MAGAWCQGWRAAGSDMVRQGGHQLEYRTLGGRHHCPVPLRYFSFSGGNSELDRLRRELYAGRCRRNPRLRRRVPVYFLIWPFRSLFKAWRASRIWGEAAWRIGAPRPWRQVPRLWWLAVRHNLTFNAYYEFRLWRDAPFSRAGRFMEDFEAIWFADETMREQDRHLLDDKLGFFEFCRRHGLPGIPVVACISASGKVQWHDADGCLPACDLFVKNRSLWSGIGAAVWVRDDVSNTWSCGGARLGEEALLARLRRDAQRLAPVGSARNGHSQDEGGLIVQRRVRNHAAVAALGADAIATLRCYTWRVGRSRVEVFRAYWRIPRAGMITDHASRGGLSAAVDADGTLRRPRSCRLASVGDDHPDTRVRITGRRLPGYQKMLALCQAAHAAAGIDGVLAWDVALLESGPTLVEGGTCGSLERPQLAFDEPLGDTEFVGIAGRLLREAGRRARSTH